jgi:hypothetical protein
MVLATVRGIASVDCVASPASNPRRHRELGGVMDDLQIHGTIEQLVAEEHEALGAGGRREREPGREFFDPVSVGHSLPSSSFGV